MVWHDTGQRLWPSDHSQVKRRKKTSTRMFKVRIPGFIMWAREKWACTACPWQLDRETMQNVEMQGLKGCLTKKVQPIWVVFEATDGIQDQARRATGKNCGHRFPPLRKHANTKNLRTGYGTQAPTAKRRSTGSINRMLAICAASTLRVTNAVLTASHAPSFPDMG